MPSVTHEELIDERNWAELRKRLKRISAGVRVGELLFYISECSALPVDIVEALFEKLRQIRKEEDDEESGVKFSLSEDRYGSIDNDFFRGVCNFRRERGYSKRFFNVCRYQDVATLWVFFREFTRYMDKPLPYKATRVTLAHVWKEYFGSKENEEEILSVSSMERLKKKERLWTLWQKTELLIRLSSPGGLDTDMKEYPLIHQMIHVHVPNVILWFAIRLYPQKVRTKLPKSKSLPLHLAAEYNNFDTEAVWGFTTASFNSETLKKLKQETRIVELILEAYPEGAAMKTSQGTLPLDFLLNLEYESWTMNDWTKRCVLKLMEKAPNALSRVSRLNRMLPFMTAASIHDQNTIKANSKREETDMLRRKLELSYMLLRENPGMVASGIVESAQEKYLKGKLAQADARIKELEEQLRKQQDRDQSCVETTVGAKRKRSDDV